MFKLIKQVLIGLVIFNRSSASIVNASGHKCISLHNEQCMTQVTILSLMCILMNTVKNYVTIHFQLI